MTINQNPLKMKLKAPQYPIMKKQEKISSRCTMKCNSGTGPLWRSRLQKKRDEAVCRDKITGNEAESCPQQFKKLLLFSGNDYLGLSSHPTIGKAAAKAALELGMGPRGSALICGYTNYHRLLESCLADLKMKEDCLLCPTGFAANMALMVALGNIGALLTAGRTPLEEERIAIFSDSLNHASIIDGIRLAERQKSVELFIYRHCDMSHLNALLLNCKTKRKVVVTDGLFSMDGDFAPMIELVKLRRKHQFLLVIDDAHGTFVCGKNGGGVAEEFNCEGDVDICIGTLSKAAGCHGGFIACSKRWKKLIQSRGRSFIFSTAMPVPIAAAAHAAVIVAKKETWRRREIWKRVQDFHALTGIPITSPIISLIVGTAVIVAKKETWRRREIWKRVQDFHALTGIPITSPIISLIVGSEEKALQSSRQLLNMPIILEQAFVEIWFPCNCNQTPNSASQLMQLITGE
ncbi:8-amino-7-oxononanoate synthase [Quercus suber]|uniref:8-amino-7-oxononanoate synthase n=1 Tax=Quercus suber TaxID=58331 RepID=A0AAW0ISV1_QUESU